MWKELKNRWKADSPKLFRWITRVGSGIAAISLAVHLAVVGRWCRAVLVD
jgi:hypothetical protein